MIRPATPADAPAIAAIYNPYVRDTTITFETEHVSADVMAGRIREVLEGGYPYLVWTADDGTVTGYAYAHRFHERAAYARTAELSVYLDAAHTGRGVGTQLYTELIERCRQRGIHLVVALVALPNPASAGMQARAGMELRGVLPEAGFKLGEWRDVGYYARVLN